MEEYVALLSDAEYSESLQEDATTAITEFDFLLNEAERAGGGANGIGQAMQRPEVSAAMSGRSVRSSRSNSVPRPARSTPPTSSRCETLGDPRGP